jgi:hypothetical protein
MPKRKTAAADEKKNVKKEKTYEENEKESWSKTKAELEEEFAEIITPQEVLKLEINRLEKLNKKKEEEKPVELMNHIIAEEKEQAAATKEKQEKESKSMKVKAWQDRLWDYGSYQECLWDKTRELGYEKKTKDYTIASNEKWEEWMSFPKEEEWKKNMESGFYDRVEYEVPLRADQDPAAVRFDVGMCWLKVQIEESLAVLKEINSWSFEWRQKVQSKIHELELLADPCWHKDWDPKDIFYIQVFYFICLFV